MFKGTQLSLKYPLHAVAYGPGTVPIDSRHLQLASQLFDRAATKLSRVVSDPDQIDGATTLPEVAFLGRSNVGKSSLLNALLYPHSRNKQSLELKDFARVANHPGFTKHLNFYTVGSQLRVVDVPGYGYGSKEKQGNLVLTYLEHQKSLRRVYLLINGQIGPTQLDLDIMDTLNQTGTSWQPIFTKLDSLVTSRQRLEPVNSGPLLKKNSADAFLAKVSRKRQPRPAVTNYCVSRADSDTINLCVSQGLEAIMQGNHPALYAMAVGTSATKTLGFLGIPELRASVLQACGLARI